VVSLSRSVSSSSRRGPASEDLEKAVVLAHDLIKAVALV
jgi:hypothetical protein